MKVVCKILAGSHLFGTNGPNSDLDYKGIYIPSDREILLGNYSDTINKSTGNDHTKNNKDDIDEEYYSLRKFLKLLAQGQTNAIEMLFAPDEMVIETSEIWENIRKNRSKLVSKKITALISYARQQANKYGIKGSRMGELSNCIAALKEVHKAVGFDDAKLKHGWELLVEKLKGFEHVEFIEMEVSANMKTSKIPGINVLGKKFDHHVGFIYVLEILKKIYKNYGHRAREAKNNNGIDWKALSHATRVSIQGLELLTKGHITLPLSEENCALVKNIKLGLVDYKKVGQIIEDRLVRLESARKTSSLPEEVSQEFLDGLLCDIHMEIVNEKV